MRSSNEIRQEEFRVAIMETLSRLRGAGVAVDETADPEDLARLLDAVEQFEAVVRTCGGDLMIDYPDDPRLVIPRQSSDESIAAYRLRILDAAEKLR